MSGQKWQREVVGSSSGWEIHTSLQQRSFRLFTLLIFAGSTFFLFLKEVKSLPKSRALKLTFAHWIREWWDVRGEYLSSFFSYFWSAKMSHQARIWIAEKRAAICVCFPLTFPGLQFRFFESSSANLRPILVRLACHWLQIDFVIVRPSHWIRKLAKVGRISSIKGTCW